MSISGSFSSTISAAVASPIAAAAPPPVAATAVSVATAAAAATVFVDRYLHNLPALRQITAKKALFS